MAHSARVCSIVALCVVALFNAVAIATEPKNHAGVQQNSSSSGNVISSNSVLVALLDTRYDYTELAELVEKALLLQTLEEVVGSNNITIFAPNNAFLEKNLDPEFRRFLREPGNLKSLQKLLQFHVVPTRMVAEEWNNVTHRALNWDEELNFQLHEDSESKVMKVDLGTVTHPNAVVRPDGVIHGIDRLLVPKSVQNEFNEWRSRRVILEAVKPQGAPTVDSPRFSKKIPSTSSSSISLPPIEFALAPGPSLAPAPAPGPSSGYHWFDGESQVKDFIHTLVQYGGYNEMADILVNLTSMASEMAKLVSEGYRLTVLAPNDEAMAKLSADQLSELEHVIYYHMIPEYQTEESFYTGVRRFGKLKYDTLHIPHKVVTQEADGTVLFGEGEQSAHLFDHDIYVDGRISVQGIDKVLIPPSHQSKVKKLEREKEIAKQSKRSKGRLLGSVCNLLEKFGRNSILSTCQ